MKKIILIVLVCSVIGSCGKENTVVSETENKKETKEETFICECTYEDICIDTIQWGNAKLEDILGEWNLEAFIDTSHCIVESIDTSSEMTINFSGDIIDGNTGRNTFNGKYQLVDDKILFPNIESTEIVETEQGRRFVQALLQPNNFFATKDCLFLLSKDVLVFSNKKSLQYKTVSLFEKGSITIPLSYTIRDFWGDDSHVFEIRSATQDVVIGMERMVDFEYDTLYEFTDEMERLNIIDTDGNNIGIVAYTDSEGQFRNALGTFWLKEDTYYLNLVSLSFSKAKLKELQTILSTIKK